MEEKKEMKQQEQKTDFLLYELEKPIKLESMEIKEIDLRAIRDMTFDELADLYDLYEMTGGGGNVTGDVPLRFAKLVINKVTGYPLETLGKLGVRDGLRLRARIYRFFFLSK